MALTFLTDARGWPGSLSVEPGKQVTVPLDLLLSQNGTSMWSLLTVLGLGRKTPCARPAGFLPWALCEKALLPQAPPGRTRALRPAWSRPLSAQVLVTHSAREPSGEGVVHRRAPSSVLTSAGTGVGAGGLS